MSDAELLSASTSHKKMTQTEEGLVTQSKNYEGAFTPEKKKAVIAWSKNWLEKTAGECKSWNPRETFYSPTIEIREILDELAVITEAGSEDEDGFISEVRAKAVTAFIEELYAFCQEKSANPKEYKILIAILYRKIFSVSPSIVNYQKFSDMLRTAAEATRVPELNHVIGEYLTGEIEYSLAFMEKESAERLANTITEIPIANIVDIFHFLQGVMAGTITSDSYATRATGNICAIIDTVCEKMKLPLLNLIRETINQYATDAYEVGNYQLNKAGGRATEQIDIQNALRQVETEQGVQSPEDDQLMVIRIAKDAVVAVDASGISRKIAIFNPEDLKSPLPFSPHTIRTEQALLEKEPRPDNLYEMASRVNNITRAFGIAYASLENPSLDPMNDSNSELITTWDGRRINHDSQVPIETGAQKMAQISNVLTQEQWSFCIKHGATMTQLIESMEDRIEAGEDPDEVNDEFFSDRNMCELNELLIIINEKWDAFSKDIKRAGDELLSIADKRLLPVDYKPFSEVAKMPDAVPFGSDEPKQLTLLLEQLQRPAIRTAIKKELNIQLETLTLRSQVHLLRFLASQHTEMFGRLSRALNNNDPLKQKILESFLANAEDEKYGAAIIELAEKTNTATLELILSKYLEIVEMVKGIDIYFAHIFTGEKTPNHAQRATIVQKLLHHGNELLLSYSQKADSLKSEDIANQLDQVRADTLLFLTTLKTAKEAGLDLELEDVVGAELTVRRGKEVPPDDVTYMRSIYSRNYAKKPKLQALLLKTFDEKIQDPNTRWYLFRHDGKVRAFCRFDDNFGFDEAIEEPILYFGSFNADPLYQSARLGDAMIETSVLKEFGIVRADCALDTPISSRYIEMGFIADRAEEYKETEVKSVSIEYDKLTTKKLYLTKKLLRSEIISRQGEGKIGDPILIRATEDPHALCSEILPKGYVLTRYFSAGAQRSWCVFERAKKRQERDWIII